MLEIKEIKKSYGNFQVLDISNYNLQPGKYWIKGANGSGKSTLLKIIAGLLPFKGDIVVNHSYSIHKTAVKYRSLVNHAPAEPVYPSFISGQQLVDFYKNLKNGNPSQIDVLKNMLGITDFLNNPTGTYSSGMLKKLSLLLAFIGLPQLVLLDEPFTTLDVATQHSLQSFIKSNNNCSIILTSHHDISLAEIPFTKIYAIQNKTLVSV